LGKTGRRMESGNRSHNEDHQTLTSICASGATPAVRIHADSEVMRRW
jgi:hypothetical protein